MPTMIKIDKESSGHSQTVDESSQSRGDAELAFQFLDNRPEATFQRKLQQIANTSPQAENTAQLQNIVGKFQGRSSFSAPVQLEESEESLFGSEKGAFLEALRMQLILTGNDIFKGYPLDASRCPWMNGWFRLFSSKSSAAIEASVLAYLGLEQAPPAHQIIAMVCAKAAMGFRSQLETGNPTHLPMEVQGEKGGEWEQAWKGISHQSTEQIAQPKYVGDAVVQLGKCCSPEEDEPSVKPKQREVVRKVRQSVEEVHHSQSSELDELSHEIEPPSYDVEKIDSIRGEKLGIFVERVIQDIKSKNYRRAYLALMDEKEATSMGLSINKGKLNLYDPDQASTPDYLNNMFYPKSCSVKISDVASTTFDITDQTHEKTVFRHQNADTYWRPLLMGNLEEYMHALQHARGKFLSPSTNKFKQTVPLQKQKGMSFHEIDILAIMNDVGLKPENSGFVEAHGESRIPFWEWLTGVKYQMEEVDRSEIDDFFADFDYNGED